jgi:hypothetical protein
MKSSNSRNLAKIGLDDIVDYKFNLRKVVFLKK